MWAHDAESIRAFRNGTAMLIYILSLLGVAVFAISGCLAAGRKQLDWVGVFALATATALGGGTLRDILLNRDTVFWIADTNHLWVILASVAFTIFYTRFFKIPEKALRLADALGLALFAIVGAQVAEQHVDSALIIVLMGIITGAAGGVIRDICSDETPLLFRSAEPLYSIAALSGLVAYVGLKALGIDERIAALIGTSIIAMTRIIAIRWNICLPTYSLERPTT